MRRVLRLATAMTLLAAIGLVSQAAPAGATQQASQASQASQQTATTRTVRYGPFTIPAASGGEPGMLENQLQLWTSKPCTNCYITSMTPNLVYADGTTANVNTGAMLHHIVLASQFKSDPTCGGDWLGLAGGRFFASGNERTVIALPSGYGYKVDWYDQWNLIYDLMNMATQAKTVYVQMSFTYQSASSGLEPVRPVWLDVDQCGDSEYSVPAGPSDTHWDWNVNVPGRVVAIGGHVHDEGVRIEATNQSTGQSICNSVARYGETPEYIDMMGRARLSSMSRCIADPVATIGRGQTIRVHSVYDATVPHDGVMGIMIGYIDET